ncbi:hypothetical protein C8F04DRAFT_1178428 [Mycena alexandri]|uniref:Uncharacterized protein n=1 Tax=Mycena alexandri TaxID=1745969 RepID=A0AAD6X9P6_9AGAR|nr:hypothetical protein C8F04DRAFT_1178428 [Mycena alexandri]
MAEMVIPEARDSRRPFDSGGRYGCEVLLRTRAVVENFALGPSLSGPVAEQETLNAEYEAAGYRKSTGVDATDVFRIAKRSRQAALNTCKTTCNGERATERRRRSVARTVWQASRGRDRGEDFRVDATPRLQADTKMKTGGEGGYRQLAKGLQSDEVATAMSHSSVNNSGCVFGLEVEVGSLTTQENPSFRPANSLSAVQSQTAFLVLVFPFRVSSLAAHFAFCLRAVSWPAPIGANSHPLTPWFLNFVPCPMTTSSLRLTLKRNLLAPTPEPNVPSKCMTFCERRFLLDLVYIQRMEPVSFLWTNRQKFPTPPLLAILTAGPMINNLANHLNPRHSIAIDPNPWSLRVHRKRKTS